MALTVVQESLFHAPANAGPGYPAEVRSDLITRLVPCATLLLFDAIRGGGRAAQSPGLVPPPMRPGAPWPMGLEMPRPFDAAEMNPRLAVLASGERDSAEATSGGGQATAPSEGPTISGPRSPAARCTTDLLLQGSAACSWDAGRPPASRQLAAW